MTLLPLADALETARSARTAGRPLLLFSDFDGTLVEIDENPFHCEPTAEVRALLGELAGRPGCRAAVVSGRDLADLRPRVGVPGLCYAGNHGLEMAGPGWQEYAPGAEAGRDRLQELIPVLEAVASPVPGAWVQNKGLTASVHYRQSPPESVPELSAAVAWAVAPASDLFHLKAGKMVLEIRPRLLWHKGSAVGRLTERWGDADPLPIFLGDDTTDEDAFAVLPEGVTVLVGPERPTAARWRCDGPADVAGFLRGLAALPPNRGPHLRPAG